MGGAWRFLEIKDEEKTVGFEGEYLQIEPGKCLVFAWAKVTEFATGDREATPYSHVEVIFSEKGKGTDVRVVHSKIHSEELLKGFAGGWEKGFGNMSALLNFFGGD